MIIESFVILSETKDGLNGRKEVYHLITINSFVIEKNIVLLKFSSTTMVFSP